MSLALLIPSLNGRMRLEACLPLLAASISHQPALADSQVMVVLRGSLDGSITMLEALRRRLAFGLKVLALDADASGLGHALQEGIRACEANTILLLEDDVVCDAETLSRHVAFHQVHAQSVALGPLAFVDGLKRPISRPSWMSCSSNISFPRALALGLDGSGFPDLDAGAWLELGWRLQAKAPFRALPDANAQHTVVTGLGYARQSGYWATRLANQHQAQVSSGTHLAQKLLKRGLLNPLGDALLGSNPTYRFERAFLQGAREARRELESLG